MLITERSDRAQFRTSPSFSLGEATRIRRDILARKPELECPRCAGHLHVVDTRGAQDSVWITTCRDCRLSVLVHCRVGDLA
jgi:hypothetical protein